MLMYLKDNEMVMVIINCYMWLYEPLHFMMVIVYHHHYHLSTSLLEIINYQCYFYLGVGNQTSNIAKYYCKSTMFLCYIYLFERKMSAGR